MKIYAERPTPRKARRVWDYVTTMRGREPDLLWKNPNCWMTPQVVGNAWGWWIAEFKGTLEPYEPVHPSNV